MSTRVGFLDSGLGLVGYADAFLRRYPGAELVLSMDPDFMPYGALTPEQLVERGLLSARRAVEQGAEGIVVACNSLSVHALDAIRAELEPTIPVVGTVPAVRQAALTGKPFAVWATVATTGSQYQADLINKFAADIPVAAVACPGLAEAIDAGDRDAAALAADDAASRTPDNVTSVVLGCTHFGLIEDIIGERLGEGIRIFDSPEAVARQMGRRMGLAAVDDVSLGDSDTLKGIAAMAAHRTHTSGQIFAVLQSGRPGRLPERMAAYAAGRRLLHLP